MQPVSEYKPTLKDYELEGEMQKLLRQIKATSNKFLARKLWAEYTKLHSRRSPGMVRYLEKQKGLR